MTRLERIKADYLALFVCAGCEQQRDDVAMRNGWPLCAPCQSELERRYLEGTEEMFE